MDYFFYTFALGLFGLVVYWDAYFLREKNPQAYDAIIKISPLQSGLLAGGLILLVVPVYFYLYLRQRLVAELNSSSSAQPDLLSDMLGIIIRWVAGIILISLIIRAMNFFIPHFDNKLAGLLLSTILSLGLVLFFILLMSRSYTHIKLKELLAWQRPAISWTASLGAAIFLGAIFAAASAWLIVNRADNPTTPLSEVMNANESVTVMMIFYLLAIFIAPAVEELIFRGYFFTAVASRKSARFTFFTIGFMFAFLHVHQYLGDWLAIVFVAGLGFVLTYMRLWTQSVLPAAITHTIYNGLVSILPIIFLMMTNPSYAEFVSRYSELDFSQKEELLKKSIETNPQFGEGYNSLAWVYAEEGNNLQEALVLIEKALVLDPDSDKFLDTKAEILYRKGHVIQAVEIERDLVRRFPKVEFYKKQLKRFETIK